jgi:hypothetical protein
MKKTIATLILLLTFSFNSTACECPIYELRELDNESYEWSDIVIIGNVIKTGTNYQIEVKEVLKGDINNEVIYGTTITEDDLFDGCSFFPRDKGEYLFYLKPTLKNGRTFYLYSQCLGTRKLNFDSMPFSLRTDKSKSELIKETENWINELRKRKK